MVRLIGKKGCGYVSTPRSLVADGVRGLLQGLEHTACDEAMAVGDTEAIELCSRNSRLNVPTRTGDVRKVT